MQNELLKRFLKFKKIKKEIRALIMLSTGKSSFFLTLNLMLSMQRQQFNRPIDLIQFFVADTIGWHYVEGVSKWTEDDPLFEEELIKTAATGMEIRGMLVTSDIHG